MFRTRNKMGAEFFFVLQKIIFNHFPVSNHLALRRCPCTNTAACGAGLVIHITFGGTHFFNHAIYANLSF